MSNNVQKPLLRLFTGVAQAAAGALIPGVGGAIVGGLLNRIQDNTNNALPQLGDNANGQTIECALSTTFQNYPTRLGRKFSGYSVVSNPDGVVVQNEASSNPELFIRLRKTAGAGVSTVTISVF